MITYAFLAFSLVVLIMLGFPVGFGAGTVSMIGAGYFFGDFLDPRTSSMIARLAFAKINNFLLLAIPFFLLTGRLMNVGGITERLFGFVSVVSRPLKGGLGHANVLASMIFAGMSGAATADAAGARNGGDARHAAGGLRQGIQLRHHGRLLPHRSHHPPRASRSWPTASLRRNPSARCSWAASSPAR